MGFSVDGLSPNLDHLTTAQVNECSARQMVSIVFCPVCVSADLCLGVGLTQE